MLDPSSAWLATQSHLQVQLDKQTFAAWVKPAKFESYADGVMTVTVPTAFVQDWLQSNVRRTIARALEGFLLRPVEVRYRVLPPKSSFETVTAEQRAAEIRLIEEMAAQSHPQPTPTQPAPAPSVAFSKGDPIHNDHHLKDFLPSGGSQIAHSAALAILERPGTMYTPLYFYGSTGLGKTHLLHALAHEYKTRGLNALYISAETFTNDLVRALRTQQADAFRAHYRHVDVLLVDDIQFLAGKESSQEEFFHTFNVLNNQSRQIVLAGCCPPRSIEGLQERLASRFEAGLCAELLRPDLNARLEIVRNRAAAVGTEISQATAMLAANDMRFNVRDLVGTINQVMAQALLSRQELCDDLIHTLLKEYLRKRAKTQAPQKKTKLDMDDVLQGTAQYFQLTLDDLLSKQRGQRISQARQVAVYIAREEVGASLMDIAKAFNLRSHSSVKESYQKAVVGLDKDPSFRTRIKELRDQLYATIK